MMSASRLTAWLKQVAANVERFEVALLPTDEDPSKEKVICTYPAYQPEDTTHSDFASQVLGEIQSHCDNSNTVGRYDVRALAGKNVLTSRIVRCVPNPSDCLPDPLDINQSPISANSSTQQLVRTIEALLRTNVQSFGMIQNAWKELLEIQALQIGRLQERETKLADNVLLELAKQTELDESELRKDKAIGKLTEMIEKYAPMVVQNFVGDNDDGPNGN